MKIRTLSKYFFTALLLAASSAAEAQVKLRFASQREARKMIVEKDNFIKGMGQFDLDCRVGHKGATRNELSRLQQDECREFSEGEQDTIRKYMQEIFDIAKAEGYNLPLPAEEVVFVKTTMKEEGGAGGYTRKNRIYLGQLPSDPKRLKALLSHEFFHVLTRNNAEFRRQMYGVIGFSVLDKEIVFGKDVTEARISNPDVSRYDSYAMLTVGGRRQPCTMMLQTKKEYEGGPFFSYVDICLIPLDDSLRPMVKDGKTVMYRLDECSDFYEKVGTNTRYVINPEECLADNFCHLFMGFDKAKAKGNATYEGVIKVLKEFGVN